MLSDWGGDTARKYGIFNPVTKAARRATYLIDKSGKIQEIQLDKEAADPNYAVAACERNKLKGTVASQ
jgi:peroxiredoxin